MDDDLSAALAGFPVHLTLPVQWGDQDAFRHVNNTVYFRWFESVRIAYWARIGVDALMKTTNVGPILASVSCDYRRQITFPDTVHLGARVVRIGRSSVAMEYRVVSEAARALAAEGASTVVVFDYSAAHSTPLPDAVRQAIADVEGRTFCVEPSRPKSDSTPSHL